MGNKQRKPAAKMGAFARGASKEIMTSFSELMESVSATDEARYRVSVPQSWMQGRTLYGGLSGALCLQAARQSFPSLPPLRSAQISFVGPAGGAIEMAASVLRQGKSVSFVNSDIIGEKGIATRSTFCFGAPRESQFDKMFIGAPDIPGPNDCDDFFGEAPGPHFSKNFDVRLAKGARPCTGSSENDHYLWVRFKDAPAIDDVSLLALADMPPPAILPMLSEFAPVSSMTWLLNLLTDNPQTDDNWWLFQTRAEHARQGYSSQDMMIWNTAGEPIIAGRQNVAVFA